MSSEVKEPVMDYGREYTYADYLTWTVKKRFEILKGRLFEMSPAPSKSHQDIVGELSGRFYIFFKSRQCKYYIAPFDVRIPRRNSVKDEDIITVFQPDICVVCDLSKLDERGCLGAPDLIIEILSPGNSKCEMNDKFTVYEEAGVREYWMVNYFDKTIFQYLLQNGKFIGTKPVTEDETICSAIFPELQIAVGELFEF